MNMSAVFHVQAASGHFDFLSLSELGVLETAGILRVGIPSFLQIFLVGDFEFHLKSR